MSDRLGAPRLSVVMPIRNGAAVMRGQLDALSREVITGGFEVVVADNGSTDDTAEVARGYIGRLDIRVIDASRRAGVSCARNDGVRAARASRIVLLDADDIIEPGYLGAMATELDSCGLVGSQSYSTVIGERLAAPPTELVGLREGRLPYVSGCNVGFTRAVFDDVDGFDESMAFGAEDVDFCWRAQLAGSGIALARDAVLHYTLPASKWDHFRKGIRYGRGAPELARRFPGWTEARPSVVAGSRMFAGLVWQALRAPDRKARGETLHRIGRLVGRFWGSMQTRRLRSIVPVVPGLVGAPRGVEG